MFPDILILFCCVFVVADVIVAFCFVLWRVFCFALVEIGSHCVAQSDPESLKILLTQPSDHLILFICSEDFIFIDKKT